jgi:hypothetical protein
LKTPNKKETENLGSNIKRRNAIALDSIKARSLINNIKDQNNLSDLKRVLRGRK